MMKPNNENKTRITTLKTRNRALSGLCFAFRGLSFAFFLALVAPASAQTSVESSASADHSLKQYAEATRRLYEQISVSVVRVRVDQSPESLIPPQMRKDFAQWRENFLRRGMPSPADGNPTVIRIEPKPREPRGPSGGPPPGPTPNVMEPEDPRAIERRIRAEMAAGGSYGIVKKFLEGRIPRMQDPEMLAKVHQGIMRAESLREEQNFEQVGVVLDDQGHVLLMMTLLRDASDIPIKVTSADGREFGATFVGADYLRGFSLLKLTGDTSFPPPLEQSRHRPQSGELLMCLSASTGAIGWITAPGPGVSTRRGDERFAIFGEDRGSVFLFNVSGRLAAVGTDHYALPISNMKSEIAEVKAKGYVSRRQFGVRNSPIGIDSPLRRLSALGHRPAVRVDDVIKNSLGERAGLKKGDIILTLDGRPITQLPRILQDLSTRTDDVSIGIIRDEKEMELTLPLDKPGNKQSDKSAEKFPEKPAKRD